MRSVLRYEVYTGIRYKTQPLSSVSINSIYSVTKLNQYRKGFLIWFWGWDCRGIFKDSDFDDFLDYYSNNELGFDDDAQREKLTCLKCYFCVKYDR